MHDLGDRGDGAGDRERRSAGRVVELRLRAWTIDTADADADRQHDDRELQQQDLRRQPRGAASASATRSLTDDDPAASAALDTMNEKAANRRKRNLRRQQ